MANAIEDAQSQGEEEIKALMKTAYFVAREDKMGLFGDIKYN